MFRSNYATLAPALAALLGLAACVDRPVPSAAGPSFDVSGNPGPPLPSGTNVPVFLVTSGNLPEPDPGPPTDVLVFIGGRTSVTELPGCSPDHLLVQDAVLVDAAGGRSSRKLSVILSQGIESRGELIPPGTRVAQFEAGVTCTSGGVEYRKYDDSVE